MNTFESRYEIILNIISEGVGFKLSKESLEKDLSSDIGVDSLDMFEICLSIEEIFEIDIPTEDLEKVKTPNDLVKLVEKYYN